MMWSWCNKINDVLLRKKYGRKGPDKSNGSKLPINKQNRGFTRIQGNLVLDNQFVKISELLNRLINKKNHRKVGRKGGVPLNVSH